MDRAAASILDLFRFWLKIFAVAFAMGVVSGIVMSYQFGTNWSVFSDKAGPVIGPLMAYEVLTAFFLEAGFLGVMLFGMNKVGKGLHFVATLRGRGRHVHLGVLDHRRQQLDADAGGLRDQCAGAVRAARAGWTVIFNPSFPYRLVHTVIGAYLTTALVVGASARGICCERHDAKAERRHARCSRWRCGWPRSSRRCRSRRATRRGSTRSSISPPRSLAMEGDYRSSPNGAPLVLFGLPSNADGGVRLQGRDTQARLADPEARSQRAAARAQGFPARPMGRRCRMVFWSFRIMVGLGLRDVRARAVEPARALRAASCTTGRGCTAPRW